MVTPALVMMFWRLSRRRGEGWAASGLGEPGCGGNPETMERVALPRVAPGPERVPPPLAGAAEATMVAAVPPPDGMALAGVRTARLQVCSMGAKVKLSLLSWP